MIDNNLIWSEINFFFKKKNLQMNLEIFCIALRPVSVWSAVKQVRAKEDNVSHTTVEKCLIGPIVECGH